MGSSHHPLTNLWVSQVELKVCGPDLLGDWSDQCDAPHKGERLSARYSCDSTNSARARDQDVSRHGIASSFELSVHFSRHVVDLRKVKVSVSNVSCREQLHSLAGSLGCRMLTVGHLTGDLAKGQYRPALRIVRWIAERFDEDGLAEGPQDVIRISTSGTHLVGLVQDGDDAP